MGLLVVFVDENVMVDQGQSAAPQVSVLMTFLNPGRYFAPAIQSLLDQTFADFELIAVDDGSTDESVAVLKGFDDPRIRLVKLDRRIGRTPALRLALGHARGEFVANLDADDLAAPDRLERQVECLRANPKLVLVAGLCALIDGEGRRFGTFGMPSDPQATRAMLCHTNPIAHSAVMYRRAAAEAVGGYPLDYAYAQDFGLWVRLAGMGDVAVLPFECASLREHQQRMTVVNEYMIARGWDAIRLFGEAQDLPNQDRAAIRLGRRAVALELGRLALTHARLRQPGPALRAALRGLRLEPQAFVGRVWRNLIHGRPVP